MRVRYTKDHGGRKAGTTHDLPEELAKAAVDGGYAEEANTQAAATDSAGNPGMRLRFRHAVNIEGKDYAANTVDFCPVCDEAWTAVSDGHADLDPPPGSIFANGTQPFPPEWVSRDETTEAPQPQQVMTGVPGTPVVPKVATTPAKTPAKAAPTPDTIGDDPHTKRKG